MSEPNALVMLSNVLGLLVIIGSFTVKLPVILNIFKYKSSKGLSASSLYLEIVALTCSSVYNFSRGSPLSAWAECLSILAQNFVLVCLVWFFSETDVSHALSVATAYVALVSGIISLEGDLLLMLPFAATIVSVSGLVPQIVENHRNGHTGALSVVTQTLNVAGVFVRIFTTLQLVSDMVMVSSLCISATLHCILLFQIVRMRERTNAIMNAASKKAQ